MFSDFHIHTSFSGDSKTPPEAQIEAATRLGMDEICITDHHDYATEHMTPIDFSLNIPAYLPAIGRLREKYAGRIRVSTGIELGLLRLPGALGLCDPLRPGKKPELPSRRLHGYSG